MKIREALVFFFLELHQGQKTYRRVTDLKTDGQTILQREREGL